MNDTSEATLVVRRRFPATPWQLFAAWTQPDQLRRWWGPTPARCTAADIDLQVGGRYRLASQHPDGSVTWTTGVFEVVEPPFELIYTLGTEAGLEPQERVSVHFEEHEEETELVVACERLHDQSQSDHTHDWSATLDALAQHVVRWPHLHDEAVEPR